MRTLTAFVVVGWLAALAQAGDTLAWPQFRGPGGTGVADGQKPPVNFGPDKNVKWKVAPQPISDSTQILPPYLSTTRWQIARPMPVPGIVLPCSLLKATNIVS